MRINFHLAHSFYSSAEAYNVSVMFFLPSFSRPGSSLIFSSLVNGVHFSIFDTVVIISVSRSQSRFSFHTNHFIYFVFVCFKDETTGF